MKHTPGEWEIDNASRVIAGRRRWLYQINEGNETAAECCANAHLIASAPELLGACKSALDFAGRYHHFGGAIATIGTLRQAIAKAEGL